MAVAADEPGLSDAPSSKPNRNKTDGSASEVAKALEASRKSNKAVEVVSERDATTTVFANPDGTVTQKQALAPIRAKDTDGKYVPIDLDLTEEGKRLAPKVSTDDVSFSADGTGPVSSLDVGKGRKIELSLDRDLAAPTVDGPVARYQIESEKASTPDAASRDEKTPSPTPTNANDETQNNQPDAEASPGPSESATPEPKTTTAPDEPKSAPSTVEVGPVSGGFTTNIELPQAPTGEPVYRFTIKAGGLKVVLKDQHLTFLDGDTEVATSRRLVMWDSNVDSAGDPTSPADVAATLEASGDDYVLELRPSTKYLQSSERKYPVTIDPTISLPRRGDTFYFSNQASGDTSHTEDFNLRVGSDDGARRFRSVIVFKYNRVLGTVVDQAKLTLKQYSSGAGSTGCGPQPTGFYPVDGKVAAYPTWLSGQPVVNYDARWRTTVSFNKAATAGCSGAGFVDVDVTPMVRGWAGAQQNADPGNPPTGVSGGPEQAVVLRAPDELDQTQEKRFCSINFDSTTSYCKTADVIPTLDITVQPDLGTQSWYSMTNHSLNDHSSLSANHRNGNAVVSASDASINGIGLNLNLQRTYNSQATLTNTTLGQGWQFGIGPDVYLEKKDAYRYNFHGPSGTVLGSFTRKSADSGSNDYKKFSTPIGGSGADLEYIDPGDGFTLTFRKSRTTWVFGTVDGSGNAYLTKIKDRSGNAITMTYDGTAGTRPKWSTITDASNRTYNVTYSGNTITQIASAAESGVGARTWNYSYTSGLLTGYTDAVGQSTTYAYTSNRLSTLTSPGTAEGTNKTTITYESGQAKQFGYRYVNGADTAYTYTFDYLDARPTKCDGNGDEWTTVTDPNNKGTTYCFAKRDDGSADRIAWVYDALGNKQSTQYSADNGPTNITSPTGTGPTGSTVGKYSDSFPDRLDQVTEPKNAADMASSTGYEYATPGTVPGSDYLPSAVRSGANSCTKYTYDSKGRVKDSAMGATAPYSSTDPNMPFGVCGSSPSNAVEAHRTYNDDNGVVEKAWDGNAGSSPTDDDKTIYTYWKSAAIDGSSFVPGSQWQVKSIRKPGGDCSTGSTRKLCTSYTYDGAGRVLTVTDGRGLATTYAYDKNDRTTSVLFNGANSLLCSLNLGTGCFSYTYDGEGNLTSRKTDEGTTSYVFDRMNRMKSQTTPAYGGGNDSVALAYDGVGNLTSHSELVSGTSSWHVVTYGYDSANRLTRVTEGGEDITITSDDDGRRQSVTFPKPSGSDGARVEYDYYKNGRPKELRLEKHSGTVVGKVGYDYTLTPFPAFPSIKVDSPQLQRRNVTTSPYTDQQSTIDYTYDTKERLTGAADNKSGQPDYTYEYDKVGNLKKEVVNSTPTYFGYNKPGQLCWKGDNNETGGTPTYAPRACSSTPTGDTTVNSDASGNSLGSGTGTDSYTVNDRNQVTNIDGLAMRYHDQGNDVRANISTNREVTGPLGVSAVTAGGSTILYVVRDPSGTILSYRFGTQRVNYVTEPNGNTIWLTYPSGYVTGGYKYSPYGKAKVFGEQDAPDTNKTVANNNRYRWLGAPQNLESGGSDGAYQLGARYYDTQGHFTQPDSVAGGLGDPRSTTAFNYAGGDPINQSDPSGRCYFDPTGLCGFGSKVNAGVSAVGGFVANQASAFWGEYGPGLSDLFGFAGTCFAGGSLLYSQTKENFILPYDPAEGILAATVGCAGNVIADSFGWNYTDAKGD
ncbi:hypothetical protein ASD11_15075 [Aeromicrobium sp. Root495]|nr:hypothetical protein ASD11_15075 [Aeromicrobium sp. Root495]